MWNELRFAMRMLFSSKLYAAAAMTTLALGIGAATAVFSVVDATLLRPLPFTDSNRLVALNSVQVDPAGAEQRFPLSRIELLRWRAAGAFESIDGIEARVMSLTGQGDPIVLSAGAMTSGLFRSLGAVPALGRVFTDEEEKNGANLLVLSHATWRQRFNADSDVLGRAVVLGGSPFTVVGVMPAGFRLLFDRSDVWVPLNPIIEPARANLRFMFAVGRLRGDISPPQAQSALATISTDLAREFPLGHRDARPTVTPLRESLFGPRAASLWMLAIAVTGLLALACANVANLTLGHLARRQSELAVRTLLGASAWQMTRLLLIETAALALCGGIAGVAAATAALPFLTDLYNGDGLGVVTLGLDWRVAALAGAVIATTSIVCTIVPALRLTRAARRGEALRISGTRVASGRGERRLRSSLVAVQIALAVMLLSASGTFVESLRKMLQAPPGFSADNVLTMQMLLPPALYPDVPARANFVQRMLERVQQVPGVVSAGTTQAMFLPNTTMMSLAFIEGRPADQPELMHIRHITPGYFDTLRIPIVEGRAIDLRDQMSAPAVCMVSQAFAKKYFPEGNAIGYRLRRTSASASWMTIVGVAGDVHDNGLNTAPGALFYVPYLQANTPTARVSLVVRTATPPAALADSIRRAIWEVDRNQPIDRVATMADVFSQGASPERFRTWLVTLFGIAGLALAVVGVYAVAAAAVSARSWEASLRLALGAPRWRVVATVLRESSWPVLAGVGIGVAGFAAAGGSLARFLFQTSGTDVSAVAIAAAGTLLLALIVSAIQSASLARVSLSQCWRGR